MQNMHEQSPIALLRFFYCDLAVLIDPFLELAGFGIAELVGFDDVAAMGGQQTRDGGDNANPIRAGDGQNVAESGHE